MTKLTTYDPGIDFKVRTSLNMFGTVTGRKTPSSSKYPFNASEWARNFIKPSYGNYLVYLDYASQEPAIMGYMSNDKNLIEAYQSGDIYIHTMKLFKMIDVMFQWIITWLVLLLCIKGYMYLLRSLN